MPTHLLTQRAADRRDPATPAPRTSRKPEIGSDAPVRGRGLIWAITALLVLGWLAMSGIGGPYFGRISEVAVNDQASFLPESAESTAAGDRLGDFSDGDGAPAIIVVATDDGSALDEAATTWLTGVIEDADAEGLLSGEASPPIPSEDGEALQVFAPVSADATAEDVEELRTLLAEDPPAGVEAYVTGPAGFAADLSAGFAGIDGLLLIVAFAVVFVILVIVYRSPLLPILVLLTSMAALSASIFIVWNMANADWLTINGQVQGILFILVVGAATDYSLLYVARYRDMLTTEPKPMRAAVKAVKGTLEPIAASGSTVIAGLLCLLLSDLASNRALGPVATIGIIMAMLAALTFLPAVLLIFGRAAFWPFTPKPGKTRLPATTDDSVDPASRHQRIVGRGLWARIAGTVQKRPRFWWVAVLILIALPLPAAFGFKADGVPQSEFVLGEAQARDGQEVLAEHFPSGSGSPVQIIAPEGDLAAVAEAVYSVDAVDSVTVTAQDSPSGSLPVDESGEIDTSAFAGGPGGEQGAEAGSPEQAGPPEGAAGPPEGATAEGADGEGAPAGAGGQPGFDPADLEPTVADGDVLLDATLSVAADSLEAEQAVADIRTAVHDAADGVLVGGETAIALDTNTTAVEDRTIIIPIILVVITIILMLLLRSVLAPLILVALTVVSFGTALGVSSLVFDSVFEFPGADPSVPLYAFVFLVALGIDYNIFLMSRVREESVLHGTRPGVLRGLMYTGGVITSAGVVLAATFAALAVIPIMFLVQLAFIVTFGVLLDAILVRSLLVPSLVFDMGRTIWWPMQRKLR